MDGAQPYFSIIRCSVLRSSMTALCSDLQELCTDTAIKAAVAAMKERIKTSTNIMLLPVT